MDDFAAGDADRGSRDRVLDARERFRSDAEDFELSLLSALAITVRSCAASTACNRTTQRLSSCTSTVCTAAAISLHHHQLCVDVVRPQEAPSRQYTITHSQLV